MARALYRKYRSRSLSEVVGQDHIVKTLSKALKSGRLRHAYLFSGPKGVGKTSVARILAHEANKLPYKDDANHLDIIEIDAASNRRIDEVRDLRDKVNIAPTSAPYKVYIIDEVHMLTREAFNALLKTLEEPPDHVIFILATTEAHKLPPTIISRTQHFTFRSVDSAVAVSHLADIAKREKIKIEPEALQLLAEYGGGSFRDSISLLDQLSALSKKITAEDVRQLVGLPPAKAIDQLLESIANGSTKAIVEGLEELRMSGVSPVIAAKLLADRLRQQIIGGQAASQTVELLRRLLDIAASPEPQVALELALLESVSAEKTVLAMAEEAEPTISAAAEVVAEAEITIPPAKNTAKNFDLTQWPKVLETVKKQAPSVYSALRLAKPKVEDGRLILVFEFPLHQKKVNNSKALDLISKSAEEVSGQRLEIESRVEKNRAEVIEKPGQIESISNIFGGAEVLES